MENDPLASRLAKRFRLPIAMIGAATALVIGADFLTSLIPVRFTTYAAMAIAILAAMMFFCAVFDVRLQRAVSALNAERRQEARQRGWVSRLTGLGLPAGDHLLSALSLLLVVEMLVALNVFHRVSDFALGFASFFLMGMAQIALMARGYPTDHFIPPFS